MFQTNPDMVVMLHGTRVFRDVCVCPWGASVPISNNAQVAEIDRERVLVADIAGNTVTMEWLASPHAMGHINPLSSTERRVTMEIPDPITAIAMLGTKLRVKVMGRPDLVIDMDIELMCRDDDTSCFLLQPDILVANGVPGRIPDALQWCTYYAENKCIVGRTLESGSFAFIYGHT